MFVIIVHISSTSDITIKNVNAMEGYFRNHSNITWTQHELYVYCFIGYKPRHKRTAFHNAFHKNFRYFFNLINLLDTNAVEFMI